MTQAACTIASLNYLPYVRTLCESYLRYHPGHKFYFLLIDRLPADLDLSQEMFEVILPKDLEIPNFEAIAFKYDLVELNTSVKPTFLKMLLGTGIDKLIYFDPDILICAPVDLIFDALTSSAIILTPHCISPNEGSPEGEAILLYSGIFNLGFIAVSRTEESERFLSWWEYRCLTLGYTERRNGLFVDQKWINLAPCYFDSLCILKHLGCNVAYWNLYERSLTKVRDSWVVNEKVPLVFFHFSGVNVDGGRTISKRFDQFDLTTRPDLAELFESYRAQLIRNGARTLGARSYGFGRYSNGQLINRLQRALFSAKIDEFAGSDPFEAQGPFYEWAKKKHLLSSQDSSGKHNKISYNKKDFKVRFVNSMLRLALRLLGADRYTILMKYFEYVSVLRNQGDVIE